MPTINSFIRFLNVSPGTPAVDIYGDGELIFNNIVYNELSNYLVVGPEEMHIRVFAAGEDTSPLLDTKLDIPASTTITVAIIGTQPNISLLPIFFEAEIATDDNALMRFVHLSPTAAPLDLAVNGDTLFSGVKYTQVTDFTALTTGLYDLQLRSSVEDKVLATDELKAVQRKAYTVYAIGVLQGDPLLDIFYYQDQIPYINNFSEKTEFRKDTRFEKKAPRVVLAYK